MIGWAELLPLVLGAPVMATHAAGQPMRTRHVIGDGDVRIDAIAEGAGPLVVLLPSRGRDSEDYDPVAERLAAAGFRVLRPQPRGICGSTGPAEGITLHDLARDVAAVIRAQQAGPAVLVGHAYGNWIARMTATDFPDLVRGVVVAAAAARTYPRELSAAVTRSGDLTRPDAERLRDIQATFFAPGHDASVWLHGWHPEASALQGRAAAATRQEEWWGAGRAPLLDLQAGDDPFRPPETRAQLKDEFGGRVSVVVIPDASHALLPEQPEQVADAIADWIRRLP